LDFRKLHDWPTNPHDAGRIQNEFAGLVIKESCFEKLEYITAIDTAYNNDSNRLYAAAVTMKYPELSETEKAVAQMDISFPYIPNLLGFREGPVILKTLSRLAVKPDMVVFAGHGIAHPLSFGMASHLGLLLDIPSIGCARKCLAGQYVEPGSEPGQYSLLSVANVNCGYVYRSRARVKPIFISPGYKCNLEDSLKIIINCLRGYRMPQPLRLAHLYASKYCRAGKRKEQNNNLLRKNHNHERKALKR